jgi:replicative DNA helicase
MTTQPDYRPLSAPEAETGVLGGLMRKPVLCETVGAYLDASHFGDPDLAALYQMVLAAKSKGMHPDAVTLNEICGFLPSGQGTMALAGQIQFGTVSSANVEVYARIIMERYKARKMVEVAAQIHELANSRGRIADQIAKAQALVMDLMSADESPDVITMQKALIPVFEEMDDRFNGVKVMGLDFGLEDLDKIVRSLRPGNLVIIAGRPGTGKTVLGMNLAEHVCLYGGKSALIFSLEMSSAELAKRTLASVSSISQQRLETGECLSTEEGSSAVSAAVGRLSAMDMRICDKPGLTFSRISSIARFQHRAKPLDLIVIDYIGLIGSEPGNKHQNRNQELGAISRGMKALAKELGIPVVALAQLNRGIESRADAKPRMSDLRDSGEIEQDADVIIMVHRDEDEKRGLTGLTDVDVVKVRHAKPDHAVLQFTGEFARFNAASDYHRHSEQYESQEREQQTSRPSARAKIRGGK